ncbi:Fasciclin-domain-containing protein [Thozetella sp. PMI_491]|nr:Fasciclin-domain-containing protein [Thozetella sp. PMI_491]
MNKNLPPLDADLLEEAYHRLVAQLPHIPIDESRKGETIYDIIKSIPEAASFFRAIEQQPDVAAALRSSDNEHTIFLPSDPPGETSALSNDDMEAVLLHISPHYLTTEGFLHMPNVPTLLTPPKSNGPQILRTCPFSLGWHINDSARIVEGNIRASNGIIHKIDRTISSPPALLPTLEQSGLSFFRRAIHVSNLESLLVGDGIRGRTVFAPSDAAFKALGEEILHFLLETTEGQPYLVTLVKLHVCPNLTFFSNMIWPKNNTGQRQTSADGLRRIKGRQQQLIPTLLATGELGSDPVVLTITIARYNGLIAIGVNQNARLTQQDLATSDGVVQVIGRVLFPSVGTADVSEGQGGLEAFKARMTVYNK